MIALLHRALDTVMDTNIWEVHDLENNHRDSLSCSVLACQSISLKAQGTAGLMCPKEVYVPNLKTRWTTASTTYCQGSTRLSKGPWEQCIETAVCQIDTAHDEFGSVSDGSGLVELQI